MEKVNKKLQIERLLFFSDAVIAIAMTLLIIEIKAPHLTDLPALEVQNNLYELIPKFISFFISFFVIAIYWKEHHHLFGFVTDYTDKLIWLNMVFLLSIVIMPFSTAFYSENFRLAIPYSFYCLNIFVTGILNCWVIHYISSDKNNVSLVSGNNLWRRYHIVRSLVAPLIFLLSMILSFYSITISRLCFILIFPTIYVLHRRFKKNNTSSEITES